MTEQAVELNPSSKTPVGQGSAIPLGWKATPSQPVPVVRCVQIKKDGERCKQWSLRGYTKCWRHSGPGRMPDGNVAKYAEAVQEAARLRLIDDTDMAIEALEQLVQPGTSEGIRLKAALEVLDRAGVKGGFDINVDVQVTQNPSDEISKRLAKLAEGAAHVEEMRRARQEEIEDAVVVEDSSDN